MNEILDMIESAAREEKRKRKEKIVEDFIIAEVTAMNIASMIFPDKKAKLPNPWDYYDRLFAEEKAVFEEKDQERRFQEYQARRKDYFDELNRRRQHGLM